MKKHRGKGRRNFDTAPHYSTVDMIATEKTVDMIGMEKTRTARSAVRATNSQRRRASKHSWPVRKWSKPV